MSKNIVIWGDSLAKGVVWNAQRGRHSYCERPAAQVVSEKLGVTVLNRAHFGFTAPQGMERMENDLSDGLVCDAALIEFGGNDCNFDWAAISENPEAAHEPVTPPAVFAGTLRRMASALMDRGIRPILMTLPPIDAEKYFRFFVSAGLNAANILKWLGDTQQIYRFHEMYSLMVEDVGRALQVQVLDLRRRCLAHKEYFRDMLCSDGLHPTEEGQRFAGEQIADMLLNAN